MKNIKSIFLGLGLSTIFIACNNNKAKNCTYYNKPLPTQVAFVGYFDYELINIHVYHISKQEPSDTLKVDSLLFNNLPHVIQDTSEHLFMLNEKVNYMVVLQNTGDTFDIKDLNYGDLYVEEAPEADGCKTTNLEQSPTAAKVNNRQTPVLKTDNNTPILYLTR